MKKCLIIVAGLCILLNSCNQRTQNNLQSEVKISLNSQWRGEKRDGIYNETNLLKVWPETGPELLWSYEGLGEGFTSAAIANEKLYITGLIGDNLVLYVFNLDGELLIEKVVGKEESEEWPGPRSTINVNDGKLYIYNAFGELICLDETTLNEVWKKEMLVEFDGRNTEYGYTESPLIVGDVIFMTPGGEQNNMVALNKHTGALIWTSQGEGTISAY